MGAHPTASRPGCFVGCTTLSTVSPTPRLIVLNMRPSGSSLERIHRGMAQEQAQVPQATIGSDGGRASRNARRVSPASPGAVQSGPDQRPRTLRPSGTPTRPSRVCVASHIRRVAADDGRQQLTGTHHGHRHRGCRRNEQLPHPRPEAPARHAGCGNRPDDHRLPVAAGHLYSSITLTTIVPDRLQRIRGVGPALAAYFASHHGFITPRASV